VFAWIEGQNEAPGRLPPAFVTLSDEFRLCRIGDGPGNRFFEWGLSPELIEKGLRGVNFDRRDPDFRTFRPGNRPFGVFERHFRPWEQKSNTPV